MGDRVKYLKLSGGRAGADLKIAVSGRKKVPSRFIIIIII